MMRQEEREPSPVLNPPRGIEPNGTLLRLHFEAGTLLIEGLSQESNPSPKDLLWDDRVSHHRAPGHAYRLVLAGLLRAGFRVEDTARDYQELQLELRDAPEPFEHQSQAVDAWKEAGKSGVVILPTGAGKTYVAQLAMVAIQRSTLVVVPTIDLLHQWSGVLAKAFEQEIGLLGGGSHEILPVTVSTYDSACLHMERLGAQFGLIVFDEVHHLPGDLYRQSAQDSIAPYRLGLTATYERADGREKILEDILGPVVFRRSIKDLSGDILADYKVIPRFIEMNERDFQDYTQAREFYRSFVRSHGISMASPRGWQSFLAATSRSKEGRAALSAYHLQKRMALVHEEKLQELYRILHEHHHDRVLIFTNDNHSVYTISERVLAPAITHQTPVKERKEILARFNEGIYRTIVTSKVLNEGVDVPQANVAVILSGSGSIREHVQRLGRILRRAPDKRAQLYELITQNSVETYVSERRRDHDAYQ